MAKNNTIVSLCRYPSATQVQYLGVNVIYRVHEIYHTFKIQCRVEDLLYNSKIPFWLPDYWLPMGDHKIIINTDEQIIDQVFQFPYKSENTFLQWIIRMLDVMRCNLCRTKHCIVTITLHAMIMRLLQFIGTPGDLALVVDSDLLEPLRADVV